MPNGMYGGVRGKGTKTGQKTFVPRPTRLGTKTGQKTFVPRPTRFGAFKIIIPMWRQRVYQNSNIDVGGVSK